MSRIFRPLSFVLLGVCASTVLASAQTASSPTDFSGSAPARSSSAAFVYVSGTPTTSTSEILAYTAAANGGLTPVPGSPWEESGLRLAANGKWLFSTDSLNIYSFSIAPDGAINQVASINAQQYNSSGTGGPISLFFDRSGAVLYDEDIYGNGANNTYQFFDPAKETGTLSYLGATADYAAVWVTPLSFVGDNSYGYGGSCVRGGQYIYGFERSGDGTLTALNISPPIPAAPKGGYCPYLAAADLENNVAISLTPTNGYSYVGPPQIGVYTADSSGNLTTKSTRSNMPILGVGIVNDMKMSPSGTLLAVAGTNGMQVLHFNGANPVTLFGPLMAKDEVDQVAWDDGNHLYGISRATGKLFVFTVTATNVKQAPGSPYSISSPYDLTVVPRP